GEGRRDPVQAVVGVRRVVRGGRRRGREQGQGQQEGERRRDACAPHRRPVRGRILSPFLSRRPFPLRWFGGRFAPGVPRLRSGAALRRRRWTGGASSGGPLSAAPPPNRLSSTTAARRSAASCASSALRSCVSGLGGGFSARSRARPDNATSTNRSIRSGAVA